VSAPHSGRAQERLGLLFAALCAVNGAFVPAVAKLTTSQSSPVFVAMVTSCFAGAVAALVLLWRREGHFLLRRDTGWPLLVIGALGTSIAFVLFYAGAKRTTAIETVLCLQIEPAYSLMAAWAVLGHRPTLRRAAAVAVLLIGIALAVGAQRMEVSPGVWFLLATPLCWQVSHLVVFRRLVGVPPPVLTAARYVHGSALLALYWAATGGLAAWPAAPDLLRMLPLLALQGVVLSYVGTLLWYQAITRLDLGRGTAIVVPSIPLLSLGASFVLLGEVPLPSQLAGMLLTAAGVLAFVTAPHARSSA
jgi:O-acetylserine/cysteine efflux transporter